MRVPVPTAKAVMFCLMDVSGSMDEARKDLAKRFFILLYLFLTRHYEKIDIVFIRHHTQAQEVDEQNFFHSTETGGTVVSSALVLMEEIARTRYPTSEWNIYGAQASDGDNWHHDSGRCRELLARTILPLCRYFAYVQVAEEEQNLWDEYAALAAEHARLRGAQGHRGVADLPGLPRPVQEGRGRSMIHDHRRFADRWHRARCSTPSRLHPIPHRPPPPRARAPLTWSRRPRQPAPLPAPSDWSFELIDEYHKVIRETPSASACDTYPNQLEIITAEQMMDAYASVGMPVNYRHWSYGKEFIATEKNYRRGHMGLAYEIVINSNPCISYLMEENTLAMQALVIAHAAYGHNSFFKGNYLFRMWTDAASIIDYLVYAKDYVADCEERHGIDAVEELLDSCHALMNHGVDRYRRPSKLSLAQETLRSKDREAYAQQQINDMWRTLPRRPRRPPKRRTTSASRKSRRRTCCTSSRRTRRMLEPWQREIVRIVRKVAQYFYPQRQTQVMNEGWATFWHHKLLNTMYDDGHLTDGTMIEWLKSHTNVVYQPRGHRPRLQRHQSVRARLRDVHRHQAHLRSTRPTRTGSGSPTSPGGDWLEVLDHAMRNFKDESFIGQYLSPRLMREFRLFAIRDDEKENELEVAAIHDEAGYRQVREMLVAPVRPRRARAQHPGLERQPARRPLADAAPQPAQRPAAARQRAGSAEARGAAVGIRRAARERQRRRTGAAALVGGGTRALSLSGALRERLAALDDSSQQRHPCCRTVAIGDALRCAYKSAALKQRCQRGPERLFHLVRPHEDAGAGRCHLPRQQQLLGLHRQHQQRPPRLQSQVRGARGCMTQDQ